jgi:hypothetical protein
MNPQFTLAPNTAPRLPSTEVVKYTSRFLKIGQRDSPLKQLRSDLLLAVGTPFSVVGVELVDLGGHPVTRIRL